MLYTLTRRKDSVTDELLEGVSEICKNEHNLLSLKYINGISEMWLKM